MVKKNNKNNSFDYIIYVRSGCMYCNNAIELVKNKGLNANIINCDAFINKDKEEFIKYMKNIIGKEYRYMPMIFKNNKFIGGFNELEKNINKLKKI